MNRMFGQGCGMTALALMNMIPMPFEQVRRQRQNDKMPKYRDNHVFQMMISMMEPKNYDRPSKDESDVMKDYNRRIPKDYFEADYFEKQYNGGSEDWASYAELLG